ncbi:LOW QUALITY PROTEIN: hypothetical protein MXB_1669, partial [Myxobolus squamalis]
LPESEKDKISSGQVNVDNQNFQPIYTTSLKSYFQDFFGLKVSVFFDRLIDQAIFYEDIISSKSALTRRIKHFNQQKYSTLTKIWFPYVEWYWYHYIRITLLRVFSLIFGIISICIVWSELTLPTTSPALSIVALVMKLLLRPSVHFVVPQVIN